MADSSSLPQPYALPKFCSECGCRLTGGMDRNYLTVCEPCGNKKLGALTTDDLRAALGASSSPPPPTQEWEFAPAEEFLSDLQPDELNLAAWAVEVFADESAPSMERKGQVWRLLTEVAKARRSPPPPATPSPEAIEAACRATGAQIIDPEDPLALEVVRDMPKVLCAAYAVDFGAQSRPEAKHQEGR